MRGRVTTPVCPAWSQAYLASRNAPLVRAERSQDGRRCPCDAESRSSAAVYAVHPEVVLPAPPSVATCRSPAHQTAAQPALLRLSRVASVATAALTPPRGLRAALVWSHAAPRSGFRCGSCPSPAKPAPDRPIPSTSPCPGRGIQTYRGSDDGCCW